MDPLGAFSDPLHLHPGIPVHPREVLEFRGALQAKNIAVMNMSNYVADAEALVHQQESAVLTRDAHATNLTAALAAEMEERP